MVDRPSFEVSAGDEVRIRPGSRAARLVEEALSIAQAPPAWLALEAGSMTGRVLRLPAPDEAQVPFDPAVIVEFYSR
jgi:ribosomal protein S4